jgi:hypothetical protein
MLSSGNARMGIPSPVVAPAPVLPANYAPPAATAPGPAASTPTNSQSPTAAGKGTTQAQQNTAMSTTLMQNMMLKALSQYGTVAAGPSVGPSNSLNYLN